MEKNKLRCLLIRSDLNDKCLQVMKYGLEDGYVHVRSPNPTAQQTFELNEMSNGCFLIINSISGKVLDLKNQSRKRGASILEYTYHGGQNQLWRFKDAGKKSKTGGNLYYIQSVHSQKVLDIEGGIDVEGMRVIQNDNYGHRNQLWYLQYASNPNK